MKAAFPRERVHQPYYDQLIRSSSYGFLLDMSVLDFAGLSCAEPMRDPVTIPIFVFECCIYCRHDVEVGGRCDNCGARPGDRQ